MKILLCVYVNNSINLNTRFYFWQIFLIYSSQIINVYYLHNVPFNSFFFEEYIIYRLLLNHFWSENSTMNSDIYCNQLDRLKEAIAVKWLGLLIRKKVIFYHDNTTPHVAKIVKKNYTSLDGEFCNTHRTLQTLQCLTITFLKNGNPF